MNKSNADLRVHLDHLIKRQSLRYVISDDNKENSATGKGIQGETRGQEDRILRFTDIKEYSWFGSLRKPDFQRETNAWTPEDCVAFLDSIVNGRIIPSIILWSNPETNFTYVLDGAHRLSVLRAWMTDDWGDKAKGYYDKRDKDGISEAANQVREMLSGTDGGFSVGSFANYESAYEEFTRISDLGFAPMEKMSKEEYARARFYAKAMIQHQTLYLQWEHGDYNSAEQSFLRINRKGQRLDDWESSLLEYRNSSYARCIMAIANGGENGHYWPEITDEKIQPDLLEKIKGFGDLASFIHQCLFVPPFKMPITDLTVPMMYTPGYFQKHRHLLQVIPLVVDRQIAIGEDQQLEIMKKDSKDSPETIIRNGEHILSTLDDKLEHLISPTHNSKALSIVPLFYFYNENGNYVRSLLYGFLYWMLAGTDEEIFNRKLVFSANRDRFEHFLFYHKKAIADVQEKSGAGLKSAPGTAQFFQDFLEFLNKNRTMAKNSEELEDAAMEILGKYAYVSPRSQKTKSSRGFSRKDKSQINIRELFESSIRCHICNGVINIKEGGIQYDHVQDYAISRLTDPDSGKPTHPFCNNKKIAITSYRHGKERIALPKLAIDRDATMASQTSPAQMKFWGDEDFMS